jgi:thiamine-phosphate pyrophosphorylase
LYYITDRSQFAGDENSRCGRLLAKIAEAARAGVDYIQLRERDLPARRLEVLAREAVEAVRTALRPEGGNGQPASGSGRRSRLLINSRTDIALAVGAGGVHLRSADISASEARAVCRHIREDFLIAVSCHTPAEVRMAEAQGADFAVFGPVFEKAAAPSRPGSGLAVLRQACTPANLAAGGEAAAGAGRLPVLALGGVTLGNARDCLRAGAAGIAAIRLFQEHDMAETVRALQALSSQELGDRS